MGILGKIFTWWDGATIGTHLYNMGKGRLVGTDEAGNRYFESRKGSHKDGDNRRWVIYNGSNDASRVPAEWHGWLHHTHAGDPQDYLPPVRSWEAPAAPNLTGTSSAYQPKGALAKGGHRASSAGDYQAWSPDN